MTVPEPSAGICAEEECCLHQSFMFNDPVCCICEVGQPCEYAKENAL